MTHIPYQVSDSLVTNLGKAECQYSERALIGQHEKEIQCSLHSLRLFSPVPFYTACSIGYRLKIYYHISSNEIHIFFSPMFHIYINKEI